MASILQATNYFGPKLELRSTAQLEKLAEWMAMRTGLNKSEVLMVLQEMSDAILNFNKEGTPVKFPGVGTFTPSINRNGEFSINFRADMALKNGMNTPNAYSGTIRNKANSGIDNAALKALWDAEFPDDPLVIPE
jgi:nucleoid DNA-binding protein